MSDETLIELEDWFDPYNTNCFGECGPFSVELALGLADDEWLSP